MNSYFPDVNVWVSLTTRRHLFHEVARKWFEQVDSGRVYFCRLTQLGFLRLLTNPSVMNADVKTQVQAWRAYDLLLGDERVVYHPEPDAGELDRQLRLLTSKAQFSTKDWPDAYLVAFAITGGLTLVTSDRAMKKMAEGPCVLLSAD
ncbi:MAG: TA system VapC family ribonuclease toxin [Bryobacteraceae bacterium]